MKSKALIFVLSVTAIFASFTIGYTLGISTNTSSKITSVWSRAAELGTIISGIGTLFASYVAYLALTNWKAQSKGESTLKRLLQNQENIAILCCEFLDRTTSVMGDEKNELYELVKKTENNFSILSRQIHPNTEIIKMKKLLFMPRVRIRDSGLLWDSEKQKLKELETMLKEYIAKN